MRALDRVFGCLLALGGVGHGVGSYHAYKDQPMTLLWSLSASLAVWMIAAVNLLRSGRNGDRALAWICFGGSVAWLGFALWFGVLIGNILDARALINAILTAALAIFSLRTALKSRH
jgi:hypothetical protein